jgi:hypothetical protein
VAFSLGGDRTSPLSVAIRICLTVASSLPEAAILVTMAVVACSRPQPGGIRRAADALVTGLLGHTVVPVDHDDAVDLVEVLRRQQWRERVSPHRARIVAKRTSTTTAGRPVTGCLSRRPEDHQWPQTRRRAGPCVP